jgi:hypothetical protein
MNFEKIFKKIAQTELALRLREIRHRLTYEKSDTRMAQAMERFKKCDNKKSKLQIKKELNLCKKYWGCYPLHYYRYDLYRKDKELFERELLNYIPEFFFYNLFLPFYDSKKYEILLKDKIITELLFKSLAISQPHTICKLINNHIYTNELGEGTFNALKQELEEKKYQKIFVKPVDGEGGYGIYIFNKNKSGQYLTKDNDVFNEDFLNKIGVKNDWIIQLGIEQDPEISKIYPNSVNTFRIVTENKNGNVRMLCSELRIGKDRSQMDNFSQGGIVVKIDITTGKFGEYAISEQCEYFEKHPDTNFVFKRHKILNWNKVKEFVIESAEKLPQFTYLGWDIVLTKNGPVAIETHLNFGLDGIQLVSGGLREIFQISEPQFYWKKKEKEYWNG